MIERICPLGLSLCTRKISVGVGVGPDSRKLQTREEGGPGQSGPCHCFTNAKRLKAFFLNLKSDVAKLQVAYALCYRPHPSGVGCGMPVGHVVTFSAAQSSAPIAAPAERTFRPYMQHTPYIIIIMRIPHHLQYNSPEHHASCQRQAIL